MIEKAASPWVTLPTIVVSVVLAVSECRKAEMALEAKQMEQEVGSETERLLKWAVDEMKQCQRRC